MHNMPCAHQYRYIDAYIGDIAIICKAFIPLKMGRIGGMALMMTLESLRGILPNTQMEHRNYTEGK